MVKIKYPWTKPVFMGREEEYLHDALSSTWISGGAYVQKFEKEFSLAINSPYVLTTSNGTTALYLAMLALNIGPGDEVILPGFTFVAAINMVIATGATPVFVDIDQDTWCIDPVRVQEAITSKTKAVCAVHLYGNMCDMDVLKAICRKHRLFLIEDAAEAVFSYYKGKAAGTFADAGTFSFQATKTMVMGEGGCVAVRSKKLFDRMTLIRNHGMERKPPYWHKVIGHNFRLTNLQAALGLAQLEQSHTIIELKKNIYKAYRKYLENIPGVIMQEFKKEVDPLVWAVALRIDPRVFGQNRDHVMAQLSLAGIETRPGFYPVQSMPVYKRYIRTKLPVAAKISLNVLSLPSFSTLTESQIKWICGKLNKARR